VEFIDDNREDFGVEPICTVLRSAGVSVAPSTYDAAKSRGPDAGIKPSVAAADFFGVSGRAMIPA
jgi:hypothetical protein